MLYTHRFTINATLEEVEHFHRQTASMAAITPPPIRVQIHRAPEVVESGQEMLFTLRLGFAPVHWHARFDDVNPTGFTDRQVAGPFELWSHSHRYRKIDQDTTEVIDEVTYRLSRRPLRFLLGLMMATGLPILFAYRGWKTRRLLQAPRGRG